MSCIDGVWQGLHVFMLLITHFVSTCFMTGLIWFVQIVHYPLFRAVGDEFFIHYEKQHGRLTTYVVAPVMIIELLTSTAIMLSATPGVQRWLAAAGAVLVTIIWLSTIVLQVPLHSKLESGFDSASHSRLVSTNWIRTVAWTGRAVIAAAMLGVG